MPNSVASSPPASGRMQNTEGQVQQDGASALHRVLCAESFAEKERRLSEMILQLQLLREQLLQQQDQTKVGTYVDISTFIATDNYYYYDEVVCLVHLPSESLITIGSITPGNRTLLWKKIGVLYKS